MKTKDKAVDASPIIFLFTLGFTGAVIGAILMQFM